MHDTKKDCREQADIYVNDGFRSHEMIRSMVPVAVLDLSRYDEMVEQVARVITISSQIDCGQEPPTLAKYAARAVLRSLGLLGGKR